MNKLISRGLATVATAVGFMAPVITFAQSDYYNDYYYNDYYNDYYYNGYADVSDGTAAAIGIGMIIFMIIIGLIGLVGLIFTIWMIVDAAKRNFDQKVMWILLMVFFGWIAALIYFFMIKRKNVTSSPKPAVPTTPHV